MAPLAVTLAVTPTVGLSGRALADGRRHDDLSVDQFCSVALGGVEVQEVREQELRRDALPAGDFRDWSAIDAWAVQIAAELKGGEPRGE